MAEIILNPDVEIVHDDDRKLYWLMRQAIDTAFLKAMHKHLKEEDHCYHLCSNRYIDVRQLSLKNMIDQQSMSMNPKEILEKCLASVNDELIEALTNVVAVYRECDRRGIKIK